MAETLENYSFFDKGIFHILQDALQSPRKPFVFEENNINSFIPIRYIMGNPGQDYILIYCKSAKFHFVIMQFQQTGFMRS